MVYEACVRNAGFFISSCKKKTGICRFGDSELFLGRCSDRAGIRTGTAFDAGIGVDNILAVSFADRAHRALGRTSAAADAFIGNLVSHDIYTSILFRS